MAERRKDHKGRVLKEGETYRKSDKLYIRLASGVIRK